MARIFLSGIVSDIRGKLNGSVFQGFGGETLQMRTKVVPRNPRSHFQTEVRQPFSFISSIWRYLTPTQQAGWRGATGQLITGSKLFMSSSVNLTLVSHSIVSDWVDGSAPPFMEIQIDNKQTVSLSFTCQGATQIVPGDCRLLISVTKQKPGSQIFFSPSAYTPATWYEEGTNMAATNFITPEVIARIGPLIVGNSLSLRSTVISKINGLASESSYDFAVLTL
jgi:hypothetical protein